MKSVKIIISALMLLPVFSCKESPVEPQEYVPITLDLKSQQIVDSSNNFGINLFKEIVNEAQGGENLMISSLSVSQALGMTRNGARGTTRDEMTVMMGFSVDNDEELNESNKTIRQALLKADNMVETIIANSIWYRNTFTVGQEFVDVNKKYYDAEVEGLDFTDVGGSKKTINKWVEDKTKGKIKTIVDKINPYDVMFLINAVYFKGKWKWRFKKEDTVDQPFHFADGHTGNVKMMSRETDLEYFDAGNCSGIALPYGNGHFRMIVILPDENVSLKELISGLDADIINGYVRSASMRSVDVKLPKFSFRSEAELKMPLQELGMKTAFTDFADFSGIAPASGLYVSSVKHKTFVEVNEEGTEAAAVTSVTVGVTSAGPGEGAVPFVVDRPFLFLIGEKDTGAVLFMGQVYNP